MRTLPLLLALLTLPAMAQLGRKELRTDTGLVVLHHHATGEVSTKEWMDTDERFGLTTAYDRSGKEIFRYGTRRIGGHASVHFSYHANGSVSKAEASDAPDGGIQWYKSTITFDESGNRTGFSEYGRDNHGPIPRITMQPHEPYGPTEVPHKEPEVAICQRMFVNEVFLVNATRQAGKAKVKVQNPSPALKDSEHTLAPSDTVWLGTYSMGERFTPPDTMLNMDVRRVLRNRKKSAALGVLRTDNAAGNNTTQRWYLVIHGWAPGRSTTRPGTK
jgi:hypothetical protein